MREPGYIKRIVSFTMALLIGTSIPSFSIMPARAEDSQATWDEAVDAAPNTQAEKAPSYYTYITAHAQASYPEVSDTPAVYTGGLDVEYPAQRGGVSDAVFYQTDGARASWTVQAPEEGLYALRLRCLLEEADPIHASYTVYVNGELPTLAMQDMTLPRKFKDAPIETDAAGNELRPEKEELFEWTTFFVCDPANNANGWMPVYLQAGENRIEIEATEGVALTGLTLLQPETPVSYDAYLEQKQALENNTPAGYYQKIEAEDALHTSHTELYPTSDHGSAATSPQDASKLRLNTIGQSSWDEPGQWIEWEITVPQSGLYQIGFRARQNESSGSTSTRRVTLDGEVLFDELGQAGFAYNLDWQIRMLGDETPYLIYLEKDKPHVLRMEVTYGELSESILRMEALSLEMNALYREIIMITGTGDSIDPYRDYMLDQQIPGLLDRLQTFRENLQNLQKELSALNAHSGEDSMTIERLIYRIDLFLEDPEKIPSGLSDFRSAITGLSAQAQTLKAQPLELDYLFVKSPDAPAPKANANFFAQLWFRLKLLIASYSEDYANLSGGQNGEITVWVSAGRDQGQVIKELIDNQFSPQYGVHVNLSLMQTGVNEAVATGRNPDVLLFAGDVVNLASRGVLADISQYEPFDSLKERFTADAFLPYTYQGGVYALPLEQNVNMMFYRTDIFEELQLEPPETWEEFLEVLIVLQRNHLTVCMPAGTAMAGDTSIFELLVYQNGGSIFRDDLSAVTLDSDVCYQAFKQWTEYYTRYSLEPEYVLFDRFRSGEAPLGISPITAYAQLRFGAPEIDGLWEMAPVPQVEMEDGTRSDLTIGTFTPAMVFHNDNEELCFRFLDWFTSAEVQAAYGREVEAILGIGARYNSANLDAISLLNWTTEESALLRGELERMTITPAVPASYYVGRNLTNAFRKVYNTGYSPREALLMYQDVINSEITRKNNELARRAERNGLS